MVFSIGFVVLFLGAAVSFFWIRNKRSEKYEKAILDNNIGLNKNNFCSLRVDGLSKEDLAIVYNIFAKRFDTDDFLLDVNFNLKKDLMLSREDVKDIITDFFLKTHAQYVPGTTEIKAFESGNERIETVKGILDAVVFLKEN